MFFILFNSIFAIYCLDFKSVHDFLGSQCGIIEWTKGCLRLVVHHVAGFDPTILPRDQGTMDQS